MWFASLIKRYDISCSFFHSQVLINLMFHHIIYTLFQGEMIWRMDSKRFCDAVAFSNLFPAISLNRQSGKLHCHCCTSSKHSILISFFSERPVKFEWKSVSCWPLCYFEPRFSICTFQFWSIVQNCLRFELLS